MFRVKLAAAIAVLLLSGLTLTLNSVKAKAEQLPSYPAGSEITFQWVYSCPSSKGCAFACPRAGSASHVTKLVIYLGKMRLAADKHPLALFYEYATMDNPRGYGFSIDTGLGTLACQVSGMMLDYSGPPKSTPRD
jgi:hypothetical protein